MEAVLLHFQVRPGFDDRSKFLANFGAVGKLGHERRASSLVMDAVCNPLHKPVMCILAPQLRLDSANKGNPRD